MHIEARLFEFIAAFFVFCAVLYGVLTALFATGGEEWAGQPVEAWRAVVLVSNGCVLSASGAHS